MAKQDESHGMTLATLSFQEALDETEGLRRHLLLGNGFSIAADPRFAYGSLVKLACELDPRIGRFFTAPGVDFEMAMNEASEADREVLRESFIKTIAQIHPERSEVLSTRRLDSCVDFLCQFLKRGKRGGTVFTTNYDLMLYWAVVHGHKRGRLPYIGDGLDHELLWRRDLDRVARVFYLHGGLHLYKAVIQETYRTKTRIRKLKYEEPSSNLVHLFRRHISFDQFPFLVSEGTYLEKEKKIRENDYLEIANRRFREACAQSQDALFVLGQGLNKVVDFHLVRAIARGRIPKLYLGYFRDPARALEIAADLPRRREARGLPPIEVKAFDSELVPIWTAR